jgi:hypothetical protein
LNVFLILSLIIYFFVFFYHKKNLNLTYTIKNKFNYIKIFFEAKEKICNFGVLTTYNSEIKNIIDKANDILNLIDKKIDVIKLNIYKITELNHGFFMFEARKNINLILNDVNLLLLICNKIKKILELPNTKIKTKTNLLIEYRSLASELNEFYEINISKKIESEKYDEIREKLIKKLINCGENLHLDNSLIFEELKNDVDFFLTYIKNKYKINKINNYIISRLKYISDELNNNSNVLSKDE